MNCWLLIFMVLFFSILIFMFFKVPTLNKLMNPFTIIPRIKGKFFIWFILVFSFGQLGIIATIISDLNNLIPAILKNFSDGNFYTFSIALLAAGILPFALEYLSSDEIRFRTLKMPTIIGSFLLITIMGIKFVSYSSLNLSWVSYDLYFQLILYFLSLAVSIYLLCIENMGDFDVYDHLDDKNIKKLQNKVPEEQETDDRGVKL